MKDKISNAKHEILSQLSSGQFVSGEEIGAKLGISRAAVAKHVKSLIGFGIDIFSVTGKGYRLAAPFNLIERERILLGYQGSSEIEVHGVIDSTNQRIISRIRDKDSLTDGLTVLAECQTAGRGRRGREWISPFGSHVYLSRYYRSDEGLSEVSGLSLAIGVAIVNAVKRFTGHDAQLKWPNDVLIDNKKLAGVLVDAEGQSDGFCHLVIGIGVNVNMPPRAGSQVTQPWVDLTELLNENIDRNEFIAILMTQLDWVLSEFKQNKLQNLTQIWNSMNAFSGQLVNIITGNNVKTGRCLGNCESGALNIENADKSQFKVYGGEVSLRKHAKDNDQ